MQPGLWPNPPPALPLKSRCLWEDHTVYTAELSLRLYRKKRKRQGKSKTSFTAAGFYPESVPYTVDSEER